jgi:hypothetical protein
MIKAEGLNFNIDNELEFLKILRFLRARKFDVNNTMKMIREDLIWRSENNRSTLRSQTAFEVFLYTYGYIYV